MATHREKAEKALEVARGPRNSNELAFLRAIMAASIGQLEAQLATLEKLEEIAEALKAR
jgi:hypothetical protein